MNELSEFECGPILDGEGKPVGEESVIALALTPKKLFVECDGFKYTVWALRNKVPFRLTELRSALYTGLLFQAGFTSDDFAEGGILVGSQSETAAEKAAREARLEDDPRQDAFNRLLRESPEYARARADIAAAALLSSNLPKLKGKKVSGGNLLAAGRIGEAVISTISNFMVSSASDLSAAGENENPKAENGEDGATLTKANTSENSNGSRDSKKAKSPKT